VYVHDEDLCLSQAPLHLEATLSACLKTILVCAITHIAQVPQQCATHAAL
jgi:hypothetical protein